MCTYGVYALELTWWIMPDPGFQNPMPYLAPADARKSYTWGREKKKHVEMRTNQDIN